MCCLSILCAKNKFVCQFSQTHIGIYNTLPDAAIYVAPVLLIFSISLQTHVGKRGQRERERNREKINHRNEIKILLTQLNSKPEENTHVNGISTTICGFSFEINKIRIFIVHEKKIKLRIMKK